MKQVIRTPDFPVVQTDKGLLHGYYEDGVYHFKGIRYGRAERFMLPRETEEWEGVKDAKAYGYVCPLMPEARLAQTATRHDPDNENNPMAAPFCHFEMSHVYWPMDEDCLFLNVWTKHLPGRIEPACDEGLPEEDEGKPLRPVMVWLHGGGYGAGSANEIPAQDGRNLAAFGDVVIVNLNHRLNCLGFLDLSSCGDKYRYSGIAGMADIVLALSWVRKNIAAFGGDPENVTVAGQSGGGGKAMTLLQMPPADGLYRRIISQSGAPGGLGRPVGKSVEEEKRRWQRLGEKTAAILGLTEETMGEICTMPYEKLSAAAEEAGKELGYAEGMMLFEPSPTEGWYVGRYDVFGFREETKDVPAMAGTVLGEFNFMHYLGNKKAFSESKRQKILEDAFGKDTEEVKAEFSRIYPGMDPLYALSVDWLFRPMTTSWLDKRVQFTDAPCYNYIMSFIMPYLGGVAPWHCSCIPYVFRNVEMEAAHCTAPFAEKLMDEVSAAWLSFMEDGVPVIPGLAWRPYKADDKARMMLAEESHVDDTDDTRLIRLSLKHAFR